MIEPDKMPEMRCKKLHQTTAVDQLVRQRTLRNQPPEEGFFTREQIVHVRSRVLWTGKAEETE